MFIHIQGSVRARTLQGRGSAAMQARCLSHSVLGRHCTRNVSAWRPRLRHIALKRANEVLQRSSICRAMTKDGETAVGATASAATSLENLRAMRVVDLQAKLRELGLPKTGLKEALVLRLHSALSQGQQVQGGSAAAGNVQPSTQPEATGEASPATANSKAPGTSRKPRVSKVVGPVNTDARDVKVAEGGAAGVPVATQAEERAAAVDAAAPGTQQPQKVAVAESRSSAVASTSGVNSNIRSSGKSAGGSSGINGSSDAPLQEPTAGRSRQVLERMLRSAGASTSSKGGDSVSGRSSASPAEGRRRATGSERQHDNSSPAAPKQLQQEPLPEEAQGSAALLPSRPTQLLPISGHPQVPKKRSWAGHRPPGYTAVGSAADVPFHNVVRQEDYEAMSRLYPALLSEFGQHVGDAVEPVSASERKPLPDSMPPVPPSYRKESYGSHELPGETWWEVEEAVISNASGMTLAFLGTGHNQAMHHRAHPSVALVRAKDVLMFDVGDDTQRQVSRMAVVRMAKVFRIFITCLSSDCILGLPGLLCSISASRESGHEVSDIPVHLYGPPGLTDFIDTCLKVSNTYLNVSILVHEFTMEAVPPDQRAPVLVNPRARLWCVLMPPDQLNPAGFIDGNVASFMPNQGRATTSKGASAKGGVLGSDPRANFIPLEDPVPGDPSRTDVDPLHMRWTIRMDLEGMVTAVPLQASRPTLGYIFREADRGGNLVLERCEALGVPKGASFGLLKSGVPVVTVDGRLVMPDDVLTPRRLGRKVVLLGTCSSAESLLSHDEARCADVLVAGCLTLRGREGESSKAASRDPQLRALLPADELGRVAAQLSARHVILSRFDWRLHGRAAHPYMDDVLERMTQEVAAQLSPQQRLTAAHDMYVHIIDKHEGTAFNPQEAVSKPVSALVPAQAFL